MSNQQSTIHNHTATVAVISLALRQAQDKATGPAAGRRPAYRPRVASPSHSAALSAGVGIDVDSSKVDAINQGRSYISDIPFERLAQVTGNNSFIKSISSCASTSTK